MKMNNKKEIMEKHMELIHLGACQILAGVASNLDVTFHNLDERVDTAVDLSGRILGSTYTQFAKYYDET